AGVGAEVRARARVESDADRTVHAGGAGVEVRARDGADPVHFDGIVHAVAAHVDADDAGGPRAAGRHLVGPGELHHELLADIVRALVACDEGETEKDARNTDPGLTHSELLGGWSLDTGSQNDAGRGADEAGTMPRRARTATSADSLRHAKLRSSGGLGRPPGTLPIA